jgi:molecular chaperone DnaJ
VIFEVAEDPRFERDGEDLYTEALVTYPQLVLGADIVIPLVTGEMMLRVPPSTHSGQVFHLRGRGLPQVNGGSTGDLHVRVQLWTPQDLTDEEKRIIARLGELQPGVPATEKNGKGFWAKMKETLGA